MMVRGARLLLALVLVLSASLVIDAEQTGAQPAGATVYYDSLYFPWVPNGDEINGTGPWHGTITVQNIEPLNDNRGVRIFVFDEAILHKVAMDSSYSFQDGLEDAKNYLLSPYSSMTLSAEELDLPTPGSAVAIFGMYRAALDAGALLPAPVLAGVQKQATPEGLSQARTSDEHMTVDGYTAIPFVDVAWGSQSDTCHALAGGVDLCDGAGYYQSPGGIGAGGFDGHSYLPIVQTNDGWNTVIALSNIDMTTTTAASVDVTLITTDQQGYGASGGEKWSLNPSIAPGGTTVIDVAEVVGQANWVGSVHISSEVGVVAAAYRSKPDTQMLVTNTSAPSLLQGPLNDETENGNARMAQIGATGYEQYAPLVFKEYNGWNTGFSFVNIAEATNTVTVTYYGPTGNVVGGDSRTISPQGQEFIYVPANQDIGLGGDGGAGFVGAAVFTSSLPFHVAVDQVKYSTGEAMSYLATASGATAGDGEEWPACAGCSELVMPLVQKGTQDGHGDISGLQVFNASSHDPVAAGVTFYNASGSAVEPSKDTPYPLSLGPAATATLYTLELTEMSQGQRSSAVIRPVSGAGQLVGVSNNVNYDVQGDGSVAFNMVNTTGQYRFPGEIGSLPEVADPIYVGSNLGELHRIDPLTGATIWTFDDFDLGFEAMAVGNDGFIFAGVGQAVLKFDPEGTLQGAFTAFDAEVTGVAIQPNGTVIRTTMGGTTVALNPEDMTVLWTHTDVPAILALATDSAGNVYLGFPGDTLRKLSPTGDELWTIQVFNDGARDVRALAIDEHDNVYVGDRFAFEIRKLSPNGDEIAVFDGFTGQIWSLAHDGAGHLYVGLSNDGEIQKRDSETGDVVWSFDTSSTFIPMDIAVDSSGNVYAAGTDTNDLENLYKLNADGNEIWRVQIPGSLNAVATN